MINSIESTTDTWLQLHACACLARPWCHGCVGGCLVFRIAVAISLKIKADDRRTLRDRST